jgi:hypothetical protein
MFSLQGKQDIWILVQEEEAPIRRKDCLNRLTNRTTKLLVSVQYRLSLFVHFYAQSNKISVTSTTSFVLPSVPTKFDQVSVLTAYQEIGIVSPHGTE